MKAQELRETFTTTLTDEQLEAAAEYFQKVSKTSPLKMASYFQEHLKNKERTMAHRPEFEAQMYGDDGSYKGRDTNNEGEQ